jgi:uncharacterized protein YutE (UPF0331/DUF86 family)
MSNATVIENKISTIQKTLKLLESYQKCTLKEIESDLTLKGAIERYLYVAVQATIDLAEAVIAYKGLRKPTTLKESFQILNENQLITSELSRTLSSMVGFRNIIEHNYEEVNLEILLSILKLHLKDIEEFIRTIQKTSL